MITFYTGETVRVRAAFTTRALTTTEKATFDTAGTLPVSVGVDPTAVSAKVVSGDGTIATYTYAASTITKSAVGVYYVDVDANADGAWQYRIWSTGTGKGATEGRFFCKGELD